MAEGDAPGTADRSYADRLVASSDIWWKRALHVQAPYQANVRHLHLGRAIDVGCGIGRNLVSLGAGSVGVDHNPHSVRVARERGLPAFTVEEFFADPRLCAPASYDGILAAHVVEHMSPQDARDVMALYVPLVHPGGTVAFICPQERGYTTDATHVTFCDHEALAGLAAGLGLAEERRYSFPLPRWAGRSFAFNEFVLVARTPLAAE